MNWKKLTIPNETATGSDATTVLIGWSALFVAIWMMFRPAILPSPISVLEALPVLWFQDGLSVAVMKSLTTNLLAIIFSATIALPLAYLSRLPIVAPVSGLLSKLRFLSPSMFYLILLFAVGSPSSIKIWMLTLGISFFLTASLVTVVTSIPDALYDDARLLRMSEWETVYYVTIRGTLPAILDAIRDNAAMGWSMLMMVEGFVRSEGGVGVLLLSQERYFFFDKVYAIALVILLVGLFQDWMLATLKEVLCPHTKKVA